MKIRTKYPLFVGITTLAVTLAITLGMVALTRSFWRRQMIDEHLSSGRFMAAASAPLLLADNVQQLTFQLQEMTKGATLTRAAIMNAQLDIVASVRGPWPELPQHLDLEKAIHTFDAQAAAHRFYIPIRFGEAPLGILLLEASEAPIQAALRRFVGLTFLLSGLVFSGLLGLSIYLINKELKPLQLISKKLDEISDGDFSVRLPVNRNDELGALSAALNNMLVRSELFFRYVDKLVIERLVRNPSLARPGGRETDLAVIFGDMRGFTEMSNRHEPDHIVHTVNLYFRLYIECVARLGGMVDKTMGDAIMIIFEGNNQDGNREYETRATMAMAAMKAASRILNLFIERHADAFLSMGIEPCEWGFALASGKAIVGNIGSPRRMDYTVMGRVVNLASRLEGLTKNGEIILSPRVHESVQNNVDALAMQAVTLKGFEADKSIRPYRVIGLRGVHGDALVRFLKVIFDKEFVSFLLSEANDLNDVEQAYKEIQSLIETTESTHLFGRNQEDARATLPSIENHG